MSPILFKIGPIFIYSYGLMIGIGMVLSMALIERDTRRSGLDCLKVLDLTLLVALSGLIGARLTAILLNLDHHILSPMSIFMVWDGGMAFYGGLIGALVAGIWFLKKNRMPAPKTLDIVATYIPLGHAFGRIGCYLQGCCHGTFTQVPWAVRFPKWISAKDGIIGTPAFIQHMNMGFVKSSDTLSLPIHPTQLYSSAVLFVIFLILLVIRKYKRFDGQVISVYLILYSVDRFFLEFFRGDPEKVLFEMTLPQLTSIIIFSAGMIAMFKFAMRKKRDGSIFVTLTSRPMTTCVTHPVRTIDVEK